MGFPAPFEARSGLLRVRGSGALAGGNRRVGAGAHVVEAGFAEERGGGGDSAGAGGLEDFAARTEALVALGGAVALGFLAVFGAAGGRAHDGLFQFDGGGQGVGFLDGVLRAALAASGA